MADDVANSLRDMIFDGSLEAGERLNEVHLARQLGVSRTVVREALTMLVGEEALISIPRRGCFVRELTREEFEDLYPLRAVLDPLALRLSGIPSSDSLRALERINRQMRSTRSMSRRVTLDEQWHLELVSRCDNQILLGLIRQLMHRFRRYGLAFGRDQRVLEFANHEHDRILEALREGDLDEACTWLSKNLSSDKDPILAWLDERQRAKRVG